MECLDMCGVLDVLIYDDPLTVIVINMFTKCNNLMSLLTLLVMSILGPLEINSWAVPVCPYIQAQCRAVSPYC